MLLTFYRAGSTLGEKQGPIENFTEPETELFRWQTLQSALSRMRSCIGINFLIPFYISVTFFFGTGKLSDVAIFWNWRC